MEKDNTTLEIAEIMAADLAEKLPEFDWPASLVEVRKLALDKYFSELVG